MTDKPRLIDADKLERFLEEEIGGLAAKRIEITIAAGLFDPDPPQQPDIKPGDRVRHKHSSFKDYGIGRVKEIAASGKRAYVKWPDYNRNKLLYPPTPAYYLISKLEKVEGEPVWDNYLYTAPKWMLDDGLIQDSADSPREGQTTIFDYI